MDVSEYLKDTRKEHAKNHISFLKDDDKKDSFVEQIKSANYKEYHHEEEMNSPKKENTLNEKNNKNKNSSHHDSIYLDGTISRATPYSYDQDDYEEIFSSKKKGLIKAALREADKAAIGSAEDYSERMGIIATKYAYKGVKTSLHAGIVATGGLVKTARIGRQLVRDTNAGFITSTDAKNIFKGSVKNSLKGSLPSAFHYAKRGTLRAIEDFEGNSDDNDFSMDVIRKPKDLYFGSRRLSNTLRFTAKGVGRAAIKSVDAARSTVFLTKKIIQNPLAIKIAAGSAAIFLVIGLLCLAMSLIVSVIPSLSVKSEDLDLTLTYEYVTKMDAEMTYDLLNVEKHYFKKIDGVFYYINGQKVAKSDFKIYTDADILLMYFDSKYNAYNFEVVSSEIEKIHKQLHQASERLWSKEVTEDGKKVTKWYVDVNLKTGSTEDYVLANLSNKKLQNYNALKEIGAYTFRTEIGSPFDVDWLPNVTTRYGWRVHPIDESLQLHHALDIAMAGGTPIKACTDGKAVVPAYSSSYGNYAKIVDSKGNYTLYAHMSKLAVSNGTEVKKGNVIGYVGTTGESTGNHLHIEYYYDGNFINPALVMERKM